MIVTKEQSFRNGKSVVLAGCRYPYEHQLFANEGAVMVRLDVSRAEQERRAMLRDGCIPTEAAFNHPGEVATDNATFDLRLDTDHLSSAEVLAAVLRHLV